LVAENKLEDFEALVMACERSHTGLIEALEASRRTNSSGTGGSATGGGG